MSTRIVILILWITTDQPRPAANALNYAIFLTMNIITVSPISRGVLLAELTYYSSGNPSIGSIVNVPIRSKVLPALVLSIARATDKKLLLRRAANTLRKIPKASGTKVLTDGFIEAAKTTSDYFVTTLGQVIDIYTPQFIFEELDKKTNKNNVSRLDESRKTLQTLVKVIASPFNERLAYYKTYIREQFARGRSVFIHVPHYVDGEALIEALSIGIEKYSFLLHSELTSKAGRALWQEALKTTHPILFIGTSKFLALPRADIGTYITESDSRSHKGVRRPFIDSRFFVKELAGETRADLIIGDTVLSLETYARVVGKQVETAEPIKSRLRHGANMLIVPMSPIDKKQKTKNKLTIFSPEALEAITETLKNSGRVLLFTNRRGYAPTTVCDDCGTVFDCPTCKVPLVLKNEDGKREFVCFHCKREFSAAARCTNCKSWRLTPLGVGFEKVFEETKANFPKIPIFRVESGVIKTSKQVEKTISDFYKESPAILVGTEMAIPYLRKPIPTSVIVSVDNMLSLPDYSISERLFSLVIHIYDATEKCLVVQTRHEKNEIFEYLTQKSISGFQENELEKRKEFNYPPFTVLVKITIIGKEDQVKSRARALREELGEWGAIVTPAFVRHSRGRFTMHVIAKIPLSSWPEPRITNILKSLPPSYIIDVNPLSLL